MVAVNHEQVARVAEFLKQIKDDGHSDLNFYSFGDYIATDMYPEINHPQTANFFFFVCLHQYGFWFGDENGYLEPLFGIFNGKEAKGSDMLWKVCKRAMDSDETVFEPARLAEISPSELSSSIFCDDNGPIPFPDLETRFQLTREYGAWFTNCVLKKEISPNNLVENANQQERPLESFLRSLRNVGGYCLDKFQKKNLLLAMTLANRPEQLLKVSDSDSWLPIIDYHLMRLTLRIGLIDLDNTLSRQWNKNRGWVTTEEEEGIRKACFEAIKELIQQSGHTMSFIDHKMWSGRKYCPEMKEPDCPNCLFDEVCKKRTELFQPVLRTTAY